VIISVPYFSSLDEHKIIPSFSGTLIELMGVGEGGEEDVAGLTNITQLARKLYVLPGHYVVYRLG
jgi:hypothetical protein